MWRLVIDGGSVCSNTRRAARLVDQRSRTMRRRSTCGDELTKAGTSYRSSSSIAPVMCLQKEPRLMESRQHMLAGLRVESPEPHAFVHRDLEAWGLIEFCSNALHEFG